MQIKPILAAMRHHKAGALLVGFQIALTLAIICNALFIIQARIARVERPSGVDESRVFVIENDWADKSSYQAIGAQVEADLIALRQLGSVEDASSTNSFPLHGSGWDNYVKMSPDQIHMTTDSSIYLSDDHTLDALGVKLISGRNFTDDEVQAAQLEEGKSWPVIIISKDLATFLFPSVDAVGKTLYVTNTNTPSTRSAATMISRRRRIAIRTRAGCTTA